MPPADADLARSLRLLGLAAFASMASMRWCDALLPALADEFSTTAGQSAQVVYAFTIAYGVMQLIYGPLGDRLGKYTVVSFAALACTAGAVASALAPSLGWLALARALSGAAAAGIIPLAMAWIGDNVPFERRQPVLAGLLGATVIGMIAGQWLAGVFADTVGWRYGFVGVALLFATAGVAMRMGARAGASTDAAGRASAEAGAAGASSLERMRRVVRDRHARRILAITAAEGAFAFSAMAFAPSHLHGRFGIAVSSAGAILALYGVGGFLYSRIVRWLLARMDALAMARAGGLLAGLSWLLFALAPGWIWTLPLCLLSGMGFYMIHNTLQTQATQMSPEQRGTAVSLFAFALFSGQSVGTAAASVIVDALSTGAVLAGCGIGLAALGLIVGAMARPRAEPARPDGRKRN
ncbi:MAG TPA: MFS transporter [Zeimonas sp.]|nr:MFS transporter [Zeimonas sp.]